MDNRELPGWRALAALFLKVVVLVFSTLQVGFYLVDKSS